ncbi:D-lactate dehydrogenase [Chitinivorax tropicus]|uniref:D-lactate dehydrogenase (cytochrome) n=1 Tax=Chitinivorax tropicus TaxID=714531 RepID=A0A840MN96_9PROT|nr:FAD-linked oxidase C-terminal domain-containing protein [Chitinivorax tropicus]MBB5017976.1 D-lactate dehydrogenase [Chitinivorax tropicus]
MSPAHQALLQILRRFLPADRLITDPLRTYAYGTDASCYRLTPQIVAKVETEQEVIQLLQAARAAAVAVTFRAAGTSLSGQAISDSVLVILGDGWRGIEIEHHGGRVRLQPGVVGAHANRALAPYRRKIGPDPASINTCKIGGIAANNASGMCCGIVHNSYHTLAAIRVIFTDGTVLDTGDAASIARFRQTHQPLLNTLADLGQLAKNNSTLAEKIQHKYRLKNTTGYSLNALVDFTDPIDILAHLMIGSEGTLGFIASITYHTVEDLQDKASCLVAFPDIHTCCEAVAALKASPVAAIELMDRAGLRSVETKPGLPEFVRGLSPTASALLIETRAQDAAQLATQMAAIEAILAQFQQEAAVAFTRDPIVCEQLWAIRKGMFPAIGAVRDTGSTVIIEDVAFPIARLAEGVQRLQALFQQHGYHEAIIFGHALEGNLHFVFTQRFDDPGQVARYQAFMADIARLVAVELGGSLKAEHGTGRNMAPFVELEWGSEGVALMRALKRAFDPTGILNPDVVLSDDAEIHLKHLKALPAAHPVVDKCIECGFCEPVCPAHQLTLSPRQRIVIWREIQRLRRDAPNSPRLASLEKDYTWLGLDTCAATGLCALQCPVGINTGELVRSLRGEQDRYRHAGSMDGVRLKLWLADSVHQLLGTRQMQRWAYRLRHWFGKRLPLWTPALPQPIHFVPPRADHTSTRPRVVYFTSCMNRVMGPARGDSEQQPLADKTIALLRKAGFEVIMPTDLDGLCCGQPLASQGRDEEADTQLRQVEMALLAASRQGQDPIYLDTSPCALRLIRKLDSRLSVYDPVAFIHTFLLDRLDFHPQAESVAVHVTCSTTHLDQGQALIELARRCARSVVVPPDVSCCGFAGDKGLTTPELNAHALRFLKSALPANCHEGVSTSRTCEIGLSHHAGLPYHSIVYLVDRCTTPKQTP